VNNNSKIIMVGPDLNSQGGMASVIKLYMDYGLNITNLSSYKDGSNLVKLFVYFLFLSKFVFILFTDKNVKIVHIHTASKVSFFRKYIALSIAKLFGKKVIFNIHPISFATFYYNSNYFVKRLIEDSLAKCDLVLVLSEIIKSKIADICKNCKIEILYNPVVIKELNVREPEIIKVLFLGKLCKEKGIYDIIEAAKYIKNSNVEINLYGDGNVEEFGNLIADNKLQNKIKIMGWISGTEKEQAYKNSDICILPSYNEGLPMSILEAMAVGLPIISTPVGGIPEAVEDCVNGFLIQSGDYVALAEKIDLLAGSNSLRTQMGEQSYKLAKEKFDIELIIKQLQNLYNKMLI